MTLVVVIDVTSVAVVTAKMSKNAVTGEGKLRAGGGGGMQSRRIPYDLSRTMRPVPSGGLPIRPLVYPAREKPTLPTTKDLNARSLRKLLGGAFDTSLMSTERPLESILKPNGTLVYDFENGRPIGKMPRGLRNLYISIPGRKRRIRIKSRRTRRKMANFLWAFSYCPVRYTWRDLGARFWPRWLREGDCRSGRSCSVPPGMTCKSDGFSRKTLLFWDCRRRAGRRADVTCRWIRIQYPVITKCSCACTQHTS